MSTTPFAKNQTAQDLVAVPVHYQLGDNLTAAGIINGPGLATDKYGFDIVSN
jgi:hypothetical protein